MRRENQHNCLFTDRSGVTDAANNPNSLLGDLHYNTATKQSTDYNYDGNGNLTQDNNKAISSITYNYLNLPQLVHMNAKGNVTYTYDASGARLSKVITDSISKHSITTLYISGFVYQQTDSITNPAGGTDTLQFIMHEEGRARWAYHKYTSGVTAYKLEYDFFEKDHLGNTRMVLTQQRDTANYLASMEAAYRATEVQLFTNITQTSYPRSSVPGYPNSVTITNPNDSVSRVDYSGTSGQKTGPSLLLKVMSGDTVNLAVQSYYNSNSVNTNNSSFTDVLNSLANALFTTTGGSHGNVSNFTSSGSTVYTGLNSFLESNDPVKTGYPKAYLNWIFLDDQFNYVSSLSGAVAVASSTYPAGTLNTVAPGSALTLNRSGYLYIWVSNETQNWDVFFDNLSVQHKQGPMLEENHYYPFGLAMAGISDKALKPNYTENKYRYNGGSELQNKEFSDGSGLELYDANARMYDPQIGRFGGIDALSSTTMGLSPYSFGINDPILSNDPTGMEATTKTAPPDYLYNVQQLLDYVQQYGLSGFDDGFYNLQIEQGGGFSPQSYYDPNFTATKGQNNEGEDGIWISFGFSTGTYKSKGYDEKTDATYGTFGGIVVGREFLSLPDFANAWNSYSDDHRYKDLDWFDGTQTYDSQLQSNYQTYNERINSGESLTQPGDRASYTEGLNNWAKMYQNDQDYRTVQGLIGGAIVAPFVGSLAVEDGANLAANSAYSYLTDPFGLSLDVTNLGLSFSPEFTLPGAIDRGIEIFNFLDDAGLINH